MSLAALIHDIAGRHDAAGRLGEDEARQLYGAMLDGGVPELELGAILSALYMKSESPAELMGFYRAIAERLYLLDMPSGGLRPVVIPSYSGTRSQINLTPLLALLLQHFGIPVLLHGTLEGNGGVATAYILRNLGVMPSATLAQAQRMLGEKHLVFVPTAVLSPGLATLLTLKNRLGICNSAHLMIKLVDPFAGEGLRLVSAGEPDELRRLHEFLAATGANALLLQSTEGEPFANPDRRPQLVCFREGEAQVLFEAEAEHIKGLSGLPDAVDATATADWIRLVLKGEAPMPLPLVNQLACCLYASGYTQDMNQAKAIAAVETGSLAAA